MRSGCIGHEGHDAAARPDRSPNRDVDAAGNGETSLANMPVYTIPEGTFELIIGTSSRCLPESRSSCFASRRTVAPELGGHGNLLYTRDNKTGESADVLDKATTPYANAEAAPKGVLQPESNTSYQLAGTDKGRSASATYTDGPIAGGGMIPGGSVERRFETAPICVATGEAFGSISWGYTRRPDGTVTQTSATTKDVPSTTAPPAFEDVRQAFYAGTFQQNARRVRQGVEHAPQRPQGRAQGNRRAEATGTHDLARRRQRQLGIGSQRVCTPGSARICS